MKSTIHLFNTALGRLGGEQIPLHVSPQEEGTLGHLCSNLFPHVLDLTLAAHEWAFALRRVSPAMLTQNILEHYLYPFRFALPADCVRPIQVTENGADDIPYVIEWKHLCTKTQRPQLVYVARITEPGLWPPTFADALAWGLAAELATARTNDNGKLQWCRQNYELALAKAIAQDRATQNPSRKPSSWGTARGTWTRGDM